jgi:hypothetical protein
MRPLYKLLLAAATALAVVPLSGASTDAGREVSGFDPHPECMVREDPECLTPGVKDCCDSLKRSEASQGVNGNVPPTTAGTQQSAPAPETPAMKA